jgi:MYXO-CTERM domain-containing protein
MRPAEPLIMKNSLLMLSAALSFSVTSFAHATTPPPEEGELLAESDLVIEGVAVSAECGAPAFVKDGAIHTEILTTVEVASVIKGEPAESIVVRGYTLQWEGEESSCYEVLEAVRTGFSGTLYLAAEPEGTFVVFNPWGQEAGEDTTNATMPECPDPEMPENPEDPESPENPTEDPEDADELEGGSQASAGCSAGASSPSSLGWLAALGALAFARGRRSRR